MDKLKIIAIEQASGHNGEIQVDARFYKIDGTPVFGRYRNQPGHYHLGQISSTFEWSNQDMKSQIYMEELKRLFPGGFEVTETIEVPYGHQMPDQWNPLKEYLERGLESKEVFLWEEELERIIELSVAMNSHRNDRGIRYERVKTNIREQSFSDQWFKENQPDPGLNSGQGLLQNLFINDKNPFSIMGKKEIVERITDRDRRIVATVIQWLGSNVGMCFLADSLKRFDAKIVYKTDNGEEREY